LLDNGTFLYVLPYFRVIKKICGETAMKALSKPLHTPWEAVLKR
jgi:hypothetical protein